MIELTDILKEALKRELTDVYNAGYETAMNKAASGEAQRGNEILEFACEERVKLIRDAIAYFFDGMDCPHCHNYIEAWGYVFPEDIEAWVKEHMPRPEPCNLADERANADASIGLEEE